MAQLLRSHGHTGQDLARGRAPPWVLRGHQQLNGRHTAWGAGTERVPAGLGLSLLCVVHIQLLCKLWGSRKQVKSGYEHSHVTCVPCSTDARPSSHPAVPKHMKSRTTSILRLVPRRLLGAASDTGC